MPKQTFFNLPDEKRRQITDVAVEEFAAHDYANVSISRFVARAGIAKGSFYQYFEDKEDLFGHVLDLIAEKKAAAFSLDHPDPEHVGLFNYFRWILANSAEFELAHPQLSQIAYRMMRDPGTSRFFTQVMESAQGYYRSLVLVGKQQGDIAPDIDDEIAATIFRLVMSEMGRHIVQHIIAKHGTDWQGQQAVFNFPEAQAMYNQVLCVLEFGLGSRGAADTRQSHNRDVTPRLKKE